MKTIATLQKEGYKSLKDTLSLTNAMQTPKIEKVVINVGTGKMKDPKRAEQIIADRLAKITGQKPSARPARLSIATFKLREGEIIGYQVTLRGPRMNTFLDKLVHIALPRTKDFRGIPTTFDEMGNYTLGIREHTIFPETADEDLKDVFGMAITVVTNTSNKAHAKVYLEYLGFPFKKDNIDTN